MTNAILRKWGAVWLGFSLALGVTVASLPTGHAQEEEGIFEGGYYDNRYADDWFYDSYSYEYTPTFDEGWYDYDVYDGYYDDGIADNDWYYDTYDDPADAGLFDI